MKQLVLLFTTNHADSLGNSCRLEMIEYFSMNYDLTIITNKPEFMRKYFPKCRIIGFREMRRTGRPPIISEVREWKRIARLVNSMNCGLTFMFDDTAPVALWIKGHVYQYVHQYGDRSISTITLRTIMTRILSLVKEYYYIKGLKRSEYVFVISKPILEILSKKGVKRLSIVPHAIYIHKYEVPLVTNFHTRIKRLRENGYFVVTYTGWVSQNRGYELMMNAMKRIVKVDSRIAMVIVGADSNYSEKIEVFSRRNQIEDNIINYGIIDKSLIPGILSFSDVCLSFLDNVPAYHISPPQKIIEYFAAGKPVICNRIEPHEWLVTNKRTGLIISNNSIDELCGAILYLKGHHAIYEEMSKNAIKEARKYDINRVYDQMLNKMV